MEPTTSTARRPRALAVLLAALALAIAPASASAQGSDQYRPSKPPEAPEEPDPPATAGTPAEPTGVGEGATGGEAPAAGDASSEAAAAVTEPTGEREELPVTGLPAVPVAGAGLAMLVLGSLGLRRFSRTRPGERALDPADPSGTRRILGR